MSYLKEMTQLTMPQLTMPQLTMPQVKRQISDIHAFISTHGLKEYIKETNSIYNNSTYEELYADPQIALVEDAFKKNINN